jgi:hypothetical protein
VITGQAVPLPKACTFSLTEGRIFGLDRDRQILIYPAPAGARPAPSAGFRVSRSRDSSQITLSIPRRVRREVNSSCAPAEPPPEPTPPFDFLAVSAKLINDSRQRCNLSREGIPHCGPFLSRSSAFLGHLVPHGRPLCL